MKHAIKITLILLLMFFLIQLIGLLVLGTYSPQIEEIQIGNESINRTTHNLPYGLEPPTDSSPEANLFQIIISITIAIILIFVLMKVKAEIFLRIWFFAVVVIALAITFNSFLNPFVKYASLVSILIALVFAYLKVFKKNVITHNLTEMLIYPGIAAIFVPLLNIPTVIGLLVLISIYDIYAVWHAGFMQKMANYQIQKVGVFSGLFVPYMNKKDKSLIVKNSKSKNKKVKVNIAILGGGDIVFPLILAGVVLHTFGLFSALIISLGATIALAALFYLSEKGRFYPAMPFISSGCMAALAIVYLLRV